jgi:hypothetical protein
MNDGFLDAECVVAHLFSIGLLQKQDWKREGRGKIQELYYPVRFYHAATRATITLEIRVDGKRHCVTKSSIRLQARIHRIDLAAVFSRCVF